MGPDRRRSFGAVYTPSSVAHRLVEVATADGRSPRTVCDPAAGDGQLLDAAMSASGARGWAGDLELPATPVGASGDARWLRSDTLLDGLGAWPDAPEDGFDLVIGNPPFRGQLLAETAWAGSERAAVVSRYGDLVRGYTDTSSLFLVAACEMAAPTGRVAFIMPMSFLSARDAAPARRRVLELATLDGLWVCPDLVFPDAQVQVCAVILDRSGPRRRPFRRWVGEGWSPLPSTVVDSDQLVARDTWGHLAAPALGIPGVELGQHGTVGELGAATAGFRDEYYGLAALVEEMPEAGTRRWAPLVTTGLVDPGVVHWGQKSARIAKQQWRRPAVDLDRLDPASSLGRWVDARLRPKVVVATQTRVIEAAADPEGVMIPSTPLIAVHATGRDLWRVLAVLLAPPVSAWARATHLGAARSAAALKLSARQIGSIPLPPDTAVWSSVAAALEADHIRVGRLDPETLRRAGESMTAAYRCGPEVTRWWEEQLGPRGARTR